MPYAGWCHPIRRSGIMVTRKLFGFEARAKGSWCGRRDLNPHGLRHQNLNLACLPIPPRPQPDAGRAFAPSGSGRASMNR